MQCSEIYENRAQSYNLEKARKEELLAKVNMFELIYNGGLFRLNSVLQVIPRNLLHRSNGSAGDAHGIEIAPESVLAATFLRLKAKGEKSAKQLSMEGMIMNS